MKKITFQSTPLSIVLAAAFFLSLTPAMAAECQNPVGGSEHSYGIPGPVTGAVIDAFNHSNPLQAQIQVVERHGFCSVYVQPDVELESHSCFGSGDENCTDTYRATKIFIRNSSEERTISGTYTISSFGHPHFNAEDLDLSDLGQTVTLSIPQSAMLMEGLSRAGITDDTGVMGMETLFAGRILCSQAVVLRPRPSCMLVNADKTTSLDLRTSAMMMRYLLNARAYIGPRNIIGSVNVGAALLTCTRVVYPGANAECTAVVEVPAAQ